jgi:hypothetical protein
MADLAPGLRRGVLDAVPPFSALLLACAGLWFPDAGARRAALLVLPWLAAALLAVVAPWKFYDHYFLILLPPLSLLGAFGFRRWCGMSCSRRWCGAPSQCWWRWSC